MQRRQKADGDAVRIVSNLHNLGDFCAPAEQVEFFANWRS
jgi:hypothetical protein